jgi:hypothetical protein
MKLKDIKKPEKRNPVAKNMGINKASTHKDKKKAQRTPRKNQKHKGKMFESFIVLCEEAKVWTKDEIKEKLKTDDRWLIRALLAIYNKQTEDEQANDMTAHYNNVGFNGLDAEWLSKMARFYKDRGFLSPKQLMHVRKKMLKYSGQLAKIANKKI